MTADGTGVSRRAYAKSRGVSEAVVRKYLTQGKLSDALLPDGTLDAEKADRLVVSQYADLVLEVGSLVTPQVTKAPCSCSTLRLPST